MLKKRDAGTQSSRRGCGHWQIYTYNRDIHCWRSMIQLLTYRSNLWFFPCHVWLLQGVTLVFSGNGLVFAVYCKFLMFSVHYISMLMMHRLHLRPPWEHLVSSNSWADKRISAAAILWRQIASLVLRSKIADVNICRNLAQKSQPFWKSSHRGVVYPNTSAQFIVSSPRGHDTGRRGQGKG